MEFESSHDVAQRLHVNVRTVQKWAKEGKIPGAKRMGKTWMLPRGTQGPKNEERASAILMPFLNSCFSLGKGVEEIEMLTNEAEKQVAYGEYYYFSGQPGKAVECVEEYLYHPDASIALSAGVVYIFSALSIGEIGQKVYAMEEKMKDVNRRMGAMTNTLELGDYAVAAALFQNAIAVMMHLPIKIKDELRQQMMYLPEGLRLFGAYTYAHQLYLHHDYSRALGVAETALQLIPGDYPVAKIYLLLMVAASQVELRRMENAKEAFMKAWAMAKRDGLIEPFADHYMLLHGLAEVCLKRTDPEGFQNVIRATRRFNKSWVKYHELASQKVLADSLTPMEFTIAMMYNKKWTIKEIASHLDVSERMVKQHISVIYEKLSVSSRDELKAYMPGL